MAISAPDCEKTFLPPARRATSLSSSWSSSAMMTGKRRKKHLVGAVRRVRRQAAWAAELDALGYGSVHCWQQADQPAFEARLRAWRGHKVAGKRMAAVVAFRQERGLPALAAPGKNESRG